MLRRAFLRASASLPNDAGLPADVELHAQHLFSGDGSMKVLKGKPDARLRAYRAGVRAMVDAGVEVLLVGVTWSTTPSKGAIRAHRMEAVGHMLAALETFVAERGDQCLVIADEEEGTTRDVYRQLLRQQETMASSCLVDAVFVDSRFTPGVQGADLITYLNKRRGRPNGRRAQAALDAMWRLLDGRVTVAAHAAPVVGEDGVTTSSVP